MHKISFNVHLQSITVLLVAIAFLNNMLAASANPEMDATLLHICITIIDECPFKQPINIIVIEMMDNPITEIRGKDFPFLRIIDDEAIEKARLVPSFKNLIPQFN